MPDGSCFRTCTTTEACPAVVGELTRGSIGTIRATVETENNGHIREVYGCPQRIRTQNCNLELSHAHVRDEESCDSPGRQFPARRSKFLAVLDPVQPPPIASPAARPHAQPATGVRRRESRRASIGLAWFAYAKDRIDE